MGSMGNDNRSLGGAEVWENGKLVRISWKEYDRRQAEKEASEQREREMALGLARELSRLASCHAPESRLLGNMPASEIQEVAEQLIKRIRGDR
jgi:hypothetical protein